MRSLGGGCQVCGHTEGKVHVLFKHEQGKALGEYELERWEEAFSEGFTVTWKFGDCE